MNPFRNPLFYSVGPILCNFDSISFRFLLSRVARADFPSPFGHIFCTLPVTPTTIMSSLTSSIILLLGIFNFYSIICLMSTLIKNVLEILFYSFYYTHHQACVRRTCSYQHCCCQCRPMLLILERTSQVAVVASR